MLEVGRRPWWLVVRFKSWMLQLGEDPYDYSIGLRLMWNNRAAMGIDVPDGEFLHADHLKIGWYPNRWPGRSRKGLGFHIRRYKMSFDAIWGRSLVMRQVVKLSSAEGAALWKVSCEGRFPVKHEGKFIILLQKVRIWPKGDWEFIVVPKR